jgi:hypothetical protein
MRELDLRLQGFFVLLHRGRDGRVKSVRMGKNLVLNNCKDHFAERLVDASPPTRLSYFCLGSGSSTPVETQTTLDSEHSGSRQAVTSWDSTGNEITLEATITASGSWQVNEVGIHNAPASSTVFVRFLIQEVNMISGETLDITWTLPLGGT